MRRDASGAPLVPGYNVDKVDVAAGVVKAAELGFGSGEDQMVAEYALMRWARGEEDGAEQTWRSYFPHDFTSWRVILAAAVASAETESEKQ